MSHGNNHSVHPLRLEDRHRDSLRKQSVADDYLTDMKSICKIANPQYKTGFVPSIECITNPLSIYYYT